MLTKGADVELVERVVRGGHVVAGRLAEDGDVAFARRDRQRAEARDACVGVEEVEPGGEGDEAAEAAAIGGADAGDERAHVEVGGGDAELIFGTALVVAEERRQLDGGAVALGVVADEQAVARAIEAIGARGGGIAGRHLPAQRIVGGEERERQPLATAQRDREAQLIVVPARQRNERRRRRPARPRRRGDRASE